MFKQMLVPLDGSERAERAVPVVARMARATGGSIVLTRVVSPTSEIWPGIEPQPTLTQSIIDADLADAAAYLEQIADSPSLTGIPTRTVALFGPPAFTILSVALSYNADLIVMCSHGYTGMSLWMLGSVTEKVARHAAVPVFILREGGPTPLTYNGDEAHPLSILVPLDGSTRSKAVLEPAASLLAALLPPELGELHLLRIVKPEQRHPELLNEREQAVYKARESLCAMETAVRDELTRARVNSSIVVDTDIARGILKVAEHGAPTTTARHYDGCDVIAMTTHGREGLQRWAMGSVAERVLHATRLPLLIVRPLDMQERVHVSQAKRRQDAEGASHVS